MKRCHGFMTPNSQPLNVTDEESDLQTRLHEQRKTDKIRKRLHLKGLTTELKHVV